MDFRALMQDYNRKKLEIEHNKNLSAEGKATEITKLQVALNKAFANYDAGAKQQLTALDEEIKSLELNRPSRPTPSTDIMALESRTVDLLLSRLSATIDQQGFLNEIRRMESGRELERLAFMRGFHRILKMAGDDARAISELKGIYINIDKSLQIPAQKAHVVKIEEATKQREELSTENMMTGMLFRQLGIPQNPGNDPWGNPVPSQW